MDSTLGAMQLGIRLSLLRVTLLAERDNAAHIADLSFRFASLELAARFTPGGAEEGKTLQGDSGVSWLWQPSGSMAEKLGAFLLVFGLSVVWPASAHRKLLVFLLDGFRSDYISEEVLESLPGFREIVNRGVKVDYLTPDFPSLSYPNYYTLMTDSQSLQGSVESTN
ncbi:hypothetical protein A6R68_15464 [Neotoma lepida]|uniref:glycerophosphocholine cholinephosphodiesterase n=1 Tax=Neotoma lepida TaxID=56216 RepID=A0A1A6H8R3_NEOLE|nr:hypothetical protein A6R68_15464 [Neotoma lepida]